jgi:hypothetical protein
VIGSFDMAGLVASCLLSGRLAGAAAAAVGCWAGRCGSRRGGGRWGSLAACPEARSPVVCHVGGSGEGLVVAVVSGG